MASFSLRTRPHLIAKRSGTHTTQARSATARICCALSTTYAVMLTISSTVTSFCNAAHGRPMHQEDRSDRRRAAEHLEHLIRGVRRIEVREHERVRGARQLREPVVLLPPLGVERHLGLHLAVELEIGPDPPHDLDRLLDLGDTGVPHGAEVRVRDHRDARLDAESLDRVGHLDRDVGERLGIGIDVEHGVAEKLHRVLQHHHVHPDRDLRARLEPEDLERGANGLGIVEPQPGDHPVGVAAIDHQRRVVIALLQQRLRGEPREALALAQLVESIGVHGVLFGARIDDLGAARQQIERHLVAHRFDLGLAAEQHRLRDAFFDDLLHRTQEPCIRGVWKRNALRIATSLAADRSHDRVRRVRDPSTSASRGTRRCRT